MTDEDRMEELFNKALGLGPAKQDKRWKAKTHEQKMDFYRRKYRGLSLEERQKLQKKKQAHDIVTKRIGKMNKDRSDKGMGTYGTHKHVFVRRDRDVKRGAMSFDTLFSQFQSLTRSEPIQAKIGENLLQELWGDRRVIVLRDERGRIRRWQRRDRI